jgi:hypothetical protein
VRLPDPQCSYAVLIGTSTYRSSELSDLPAVHNNLDGLAEVLTDPRLGGLPADHCITLSDPTDVRTVYRILRQYATFATDTLLFYFAGHGRTNLRNELYLSLVDTDPDELGVSALPFDLIREVLGDSPATNRVLILDCCFSGRAIPDMSGSDESILGQVGIEGSYTLTATPATTVALAPTGATYTAFTGELLTLIRTGVPEGPELLTFATIYRRLLHIMTNRGLPRPGQRGTGTVDQLALTRNAANPANPANRLSAAAGPVASQTDSGARGLQFEESMRNILRPNGLLIQLPLYVLGMSIVNYLFGKPLALWAVAVIITIFATPWVVVSVCRWLGRSRLVVDRTGISLRKGGRRPVHLPWNEILTVEIVEIPAVQLVCAPKPGSALPADEQARRLWTGHGFAIDLSILRDGPHAVSAALVHYSGGRYRTNGHRV